MFNLLNLKNSLFIHALKLVLCHPKESMVKPKKHLGQHFLIDEEIAKNVALLIEEKNIDYTVEVGCGKGVLTKYLFNIADKNVLALDLDMESVTYMHKHYPQRIEQVLFGDILTFDFPQGKGNLALIGNFPYNISTQIVFKMLEADEPITLFAGMFQKEVAERLCSKEGSKVYGILSVLLNTFYETHYHFTVDENAFFPPPKIKSGVISAVRRPKFELSIPYKFYKNVIKIAFGQRRKMLRNTLASFGIDEIENKSYFTMRPEQLSFVDFIDLSEQLYKIRPQC